MHAQIHVNADCFFGKLELNPDPWRVINKMTDVWIVIGGGFGMDGL